HGPAHHDPGDPPARIAAEGDALPRRATVAMGRAVGEIVRPRRGSCTAEGIKDSVATLTAARNADFRERIWHDGEVAFPILCRRDPPDGAQIRARFHLFVARHRVPPI